MIFFHLISFKKNKSKKVRRMSRLNDSNDNWLNKKDLQIKKYSHSELVC
jgi:hypothetical protein